MIDAVRPNDLALARPRMRIAEPVRLGDKAEDSVDWHRVAAHFNLPDFDGPWTVLHVRSRQEKALAKDLTTLEVPHFLPLIDTVRFHGSRKAKVCVPMFPGYLFLRGAIEQAYQADRTGRVVSIIRVAQPTKLRWEIKNLALALSEGVSLDPFPGIVPGVRVEVVGGPLRGLQGTVERRDRLDRVFLQVGMLGVGASLEIDASLVEVID